MKTPKPWREVAAPDEDVFRGTFQQAEFAADLSRVHAGEDGLGWGAWLAGATEHWRR